MDPEHRFYGTIHAPLGLTAAAEALEPCSWRVRECWSGYNWTSYLGSRDDRIELEMDSGQGPRYVFSGGVTGTEGLARDLLGEFSGLLVGKGVVHSLELYRGNGNELIAYWHYGWPQGQEEPGPPAS